MLFLDCCYGGAFGEGVAVRAAGSANVLESFPAGKLGGGRGRAVITASSAMEYSFEGNSLADEHQQQPSVFTAALVEGLSSGEADRDEDGLVSLNELYDYVYDRVRERNPKQTPGRDVELAGRPVPCPQPPASPAPARDPTRRRRCPQERQHVHEARRGGRASRSRMASPDLGAALGAYEALVEVSRSDIRYVQEAASEALGDAAVSPQPTELDFGSVSTTNLPVTTSIRLAGPPLAGAVTVSQSEAWVTATVEPPEVHVSMDTVKTGRLSGTVTLTGPTGQVVVPVTAEVVAAEVVASGPPRPSPGRRAARGRAAGKRAFRRSTPALAGHLLRPSLASAAVPLRGDTSGPAGPVEAEPAEVGTARHREQPAESETAPQQETPAPGAPTRPASSSRQYWKLSGITALVSGGPHAAVHRAATAVGRARPTRATASRRSYLLYLGLVVLGLGTLALRAGWRIQGLGALIGASIIGTVVVFDMVNTLDEGELEGMEVGFWVGFVAPVVLLVAGGLALAGARRETDLGFARSVALGLGLLVRRRARGRWGADPCFHSRWRHTPAIEGGASRDSGWRCWPCGCRWRRCFARPALLGRWALIGWCLACAAPVIATWLFWDGSTTSTSRGMWFVLLTLVAMGGLAPLVHRDRTRAPRGLTAIRPLLPRNRLDRNSHHLEILTVPYGGWPSRSAKPCDAVAAHRHPAPWKWQACWQAAGGGAD